MLVFAFLMQLLEITGYGFIVIFFHMFLLLIYVLALNGHFQVHNMSQSIFLLLPHKHVNYFLPLTFINFNQILSARQTMKQDILDDHVRLRDILIMRKSE
jgi:hypothetical protein